MTGAVSAPPLTLGRLVVLVHDYDVALAFYRAAFGAQVLFDAPNPSGGRYLHIGFGPEDGAGVWLLRAGGEAAARVGRQTRMRRRLGVSPGPVAVNGPTIWTLSMAARPVRFSW